MKIEEIKYCPSFIEEIIQLADSNSKTLGFMPQNAFIDAARKNKIIVAHESGRLIGYILYRVSVAHLRVSITHFCISNHFRGRGVSKLLFDNLVTLTKPFTKGIKLNCRRDFIHASKLWQKLGFFPVNEKKGRDKERKNILTIWWYDYGKRDLFSSYDDFTEYSFIGVLDVNVFSDLEKNDEQYKESLALNNDWIKNDLQLCIVNETINELDRELNRDIRQRTKNFLSNFKNLKYDRERFNRNFELLKRYFNYNTASQNTISDFRQLSMAIAGNSNFFITRDERLLKLTKEIQNEFNIRILTPTEVVLELDEVISESKYQHKRLAGTRLEKISLNSNSIVEIASQLHAQKEGEKKRDLKHALNKLAVDLKNVIIESIAINNEYLGLIAYLLQNQKITIPIFRVKETSLSNTLSKQLVTEVIQKALTEEIKFIEVEKKYLSNSLISALQEARFIPFRNKWIKILIPKTLSYTELKDELIKTQNSLPDISSFSKNITSKVNSNITQELLYELERTLYPLKIKELNIPNYIIPIHAIWAKNLFDSDLANQDLFGAESNLVFNRENIYYCSSRNKGRLSSPARILWYVTDDKYLSGTKSIRAISYIDDIDVDLPKKLFKKYEDLGIYEWNDIYKAVGRDINKKLLAFKFSDTELIKPIKLNRIQEIYKKYHKKNLFLQSPVSVETECFFEIYELIEKT